MNKPSREGVRGTERNEETNGYWPATNCRISDIWEIPARSRLYQIEPEGVGTPQSECLSGYISRLSFEHVVTSGALIKFELLQNSTVRLVPRHDDEAAGDRGYVQFAKSLMVNGWGEATEALIEGLERGTQMTGFETLTMLPFAKAISSYNLFAHVRRWCPECYEYMRRTERPERDLLLWTLSDVEVCSDHRISLQDTCPECTEQAPVFSSYAFPGYCPHCLAWLGKAKDERMSSDELAIWRAASVGTLIAMSPKLEVKSVAKILRQNVFACAELFANGHLGTLASLTQSNSIHHYPARRVSLGDLLRVCRKFGIPLTDLFTEQPATLREGSKDYGRAAVVRGSVPKQAENANIHRAAKRLELYSRTERLLAEILPRVNEMTRKEVLEESGVSLSYLKQNFSAVYKKMAGLMGNPRLEAQRLALKQLDEYIVELVREEISAGHFASYREIRARIPAEYRRALCTIKARVRATRAELIATATVLGDSPNSLKRSSES